MKLDATQTAKVQERFGVEAIAESNPANFKLEEVFGGHTFFLDSGGLNIVEPHPKGDEGTGMVVKLASWTQDGKHLEMQEPEVLPVKVDLGGGKSDPST